MSMQIGKCNNIEFCRTATLQKRIEIPDDEPFICPQCSSDLELVGTKRSRGGSRAALIAVQAAVIVAGGGIIGWKMLSSHAGGPPDLHAPRASAAEMSLAANPDAPTDQPAAPEPAAAPAQPAPVAGAAPAAPVAPPKVLLRLAGADVVAAHLARRLAAGYLALLGDTDIVTVDGGTPGTVQITGQESGGREAIVITASSSGAGLMALKGAGADLAMTTRAITAGERTALAPLGDLTSATSEHVIAVDAAAVVVNPASTLAAITKAQLRAALAGTLTDWSGLGQPAHPLRVYMRDAQAAASDGPAGVLGPDTDTRAAIPLGSDAEVLAAVARDPAAIGIVDWASAAGARAVPVADAGAKPVSPSDSTIATEDYPLSRRLYLYNAPGAATSFVQRFGDYVASSAGQAVVAASGFASLSIRTTVAAAPQPGAAATVVPAMATADATPVAVPGAQRLSTTFRFDSGSGSLDARGQRDIARLAAYLKARGIDGSHLVLAGFADNTGSDPANETVAQRRAQSVADALSRAGVSGEQVKSFGARFPVADNTTADGRDRNRRVEAYITQ
jgi:phosphate transport system substrate-binding protein